MISTLAETMKIKEAFLSGIFSFKDVHYITQRYLTVCSKPDRGIRENCNSRERQ